MAFLTVILTMAKITDAQPTAVYLTNIEPRRGCQRKFWSRVVDDLFSSLDLDIAEWVEDIQKGECSLKGFLSVVGESIDDVLKKHLLFWVVSCGRMTLALCLILLRIT